MVHRLGQQAQVTCVHARHPPLFLRGELRRQPFSEADEASMGIIVSAKDQRANSAALR